MQCYCKKPEREGRWSGIVAQMEFLTVSVSQEQVGWSVFPKQHYFVSHTHTD